MFSLFPALKGCIINFLLVFYFWAHKLRFLAERTRTTGRILPPRSTNRVAMADFWRTFHHEGKISPGWWGWGVHAHPLSLYLPSPVQSCRLRSSWDGRSTPPISPLPIYVLCDCHHNEHRLCRPPFVDVYNELPWWLRDFQSGGSALVKHKYILNSWWGAYCISTVMMWEKLGNIWLEPAG